MQRGNESRRNSPWRPVSIVCGKLLPTLQAYLETEMSERSDNESSQSPVSANRTTQPLISVVVPVFNAEKTLQSCLDALVSQELAEEQYEVIVIDNGSTDGTWSIIQSYGSRVRGIQELKTQSSYAARNAGVRASRAELIAFTDADCVPDSRWLRCLLESFNNNPGVGCVAGEVLAFNPVAPVERFSAQAGILRQRKSLNHRYRPYAQTANVAYRRKVFEQIGLFNGSLKSAGDADFCWRMQEQTGWELCFNEAATVQHRHRSTTRELWKQYVRYAQGNNALELLYPDYREPFRGNVSGCLRKLIVLARQSGKYLGCTLRMCDCESISREALNFAFYDVVRHCAYAFGRIRAARVKVSKSTDALQEMSCGSDYSLGVSVRPERADWSMPWLFEMDQSAMASDQVKLSRSPVASVIIRAKNEEALIGEVLTAIYQQTVRDVEVILVDSGSTDRTLEIARKFPLKIIEIRPEEFTFGRALNIGCRAAQGEFLVFVSAHAVPLTANWLACLISHFDEANVAAVWGKETRNKASRPRERIVRQNLEMFLSNYNFGLCNGNAAVRADIWRLYAFDELLPYTEDKEWAWRVLRAGYTIVHDGQALVWHYHDETLRQIWYRAHREYVGFANFLELPLPSRGEVLRRVCEQALRESLYGATWRQRIRTLTVGLPSIIVREMGRYTGLREGRTVVRSATREKVLT
jgi:glycosyltransferase involved in cell wall biosynthesis